MTNKDTMPMLKIRERITQFGGKALWCDFEYAGKKYYADLIPETKLGDGFKVMESECEIFAYETEYEIDWAELYCRRNIPVTKESLTACVEEFIRELQEGVENAEAETDPDT